MNKKLQLHNLKLALLFTWFACFGAWSQSMYRFRNYTINDGLSQSVVTCIEQDDAGTLWIGTQDGLNRFDGQQFQVFSSDFTPGLISQNIFCSLKDRNGNLWFGTSNGLVCFNKQLERFKSYEGKNHQALSIEDLVEVENGDLYLATSTQGLMRFDHKKQQLVAVQVALPSKRIHDISALTSTVLLVSTEDKGAFRWNTKTNSLTPIAPKNLVSDGWIVNDAHQFRGAAFLLATNKGLWLYDYISGSCLPFMKRLESEYEVSEISDVFINSGSEIFVATEKKGLLTLKWEKGVYKVIQSRQDIFQKNALLHDEIGSIFKDEAGILWLGTQRGLSCFDPINQGFLGVGASGNEAQGLPSESVWAFCENASGSSLFVATDNAVSHQNRNTGLYETYYLPKKDDENSIICMQYVNEHELLIGTTDGLYTLTFYGAQYTYKQVDWKKLGNAESFKRIYKIIPFNDHSYFLATKGGVLLYDHKKNSYKTFVYDPKNSKKTISPGVCRVAYKTNNGIFLFATSSGGLNQLVVDAAGNLFIQPYKYNKQIVKASTDYVSCIFEDEDDLWIGTSGSGLLQLNKVTGKVKVFSKKNGLPNNFIYGITKDDMNNLWISTNKGLCRFSLRSFTTTNFTEVNGLMSNEFNTGAYLQSVTGLHYFGGIIGYNFFRPSALNVKREPLEVKFVKFKFNDKWLLPGDKGAPFTKAFSQTNRIELRYNQRSFSVRFLTSELMNSELVEYKYRLVGSDENDVFLGNTNEIRFNSLSPGTYVLEVYARRLDGEWSTYPARIEIEIIAPFWMKWWFILLIIVVIALSIRWFIRSRIENARREQVRLEMKIAERTKEIRAQNEKIEYQKKVIEKEKNKVEEQRRLLQIEKDKTESVLRNVMPESTAEELKNKGRASARAYKTVSVLFTDFVGFTKISEGLKPTELVNRLDIYFRKFDEIIVKNNLEKIKTIGDAYMCAGGVPVRNNTNPIDAVLAALQIQDYISKLKHEAIANGTDYWDLRLGINTGEVTAGVIGSERLAYDIWGSTVNQAQRMEMMGEPGRVTISGATFKHIEPYFECTYRGKVQSKSKGLIDMFTVERIKPELSQNGEGLFPNERFQQIVNLHLYSSINYYKAERHIMKVLEKGLSSKLHYHSIAHTKDVVRAVERYALLEGVTDEGLFLLKSAATYHDAGFVESYEKNEPIGARMAEEILPKYGYSVAHIEQIKELIFVTQIPHQPKNHLEQIICDADLDYLGRDDFHEIADKLRLELREHGKIDSDRKWDEMQVSFLNMHKYFTPTAIASRQAKKEQNLKEVMERLERNEYKD